MTREQLTCDFEILEIRDEASLTTIWRCLKSNKTTGGVCPLTKICRASAEQQQVYEEQAKR